MSLIVVTPTDKHTMPMKDLQVGDVAIVRDARLIGGNSTICYVYRSIYKGLVCLNDPDRSWPHDSDYKVERLPSGTQIVLEVV